jgi:hypothetical protein
MPTMGSKCTTSDTPDPNVKTIKHDHGSLPNHYTVDDWKGLLPMTIFEAVLALKVSGFKICKMRTNVSTGKRV